MTIEQLTDYIETDDGKATIQTRINEMLENWKSENLQDMINQSINPVNEQDQKVADLQRQLESEKRIKVLKVEAGNIGLDRFVADELTVELFGHLESADAVKAVGMLNNHFTDIFNRLTTAEVDAFLRANASKPRFIPNGASNGITKDDLINMDYSQRLKVYQADPAQFQRIMNS